MKKNISEEIALFSLNANSKRIRDHVENSGKAAIYENGCIKLIIKKEKILSIPAKDVPITMNGAAEFMIENALAALLAGYTIGFDLEIIRKALNTFIPSPETTPGRLNIFNFGDFEVLIDYAHNTGGMLALGKFLAKNQSPHKVGILAGVGDRRDEDIIELGHIAATIFDEIIIRQDSSLRGRTEEEIVRLLSQGIRIENPNKPLISIPDELEAIKFAISKGKKGSLITICSDRVAEAISEVQELKKKYDVK